MVHTLQHYISCFGRLNCNKRKVETAPHKAVMLLAVIEEVRLGHITNGFVPINDRMVAAFKQEWHKYVGESALFNPAFETPFFHLAYEPFWELMRREPFVARQEYSMPMLRKNFYGAKIPEELCDYMAEETSRLLLKKALLEKHFPNYSLNDILPLAADISAHYAPSAHRPSSTKLSA